MIDRESVKDPGSAQMSGRVCQRLETCTAPITHLSKADQETLYSVPWRKWRWPAVAHCKGGC